MNIKLVPADPKFAQALYEYRQDPEARKYNPFAPMSFVEVQEQVKQACSDLKKFETEDSFLWFIELDGKAVGNFALKKISRMMLTAEIGYGVYAEFRGQGIATHMVREITKNIFAQTPLRKLTAFVHEDNLASRKVLEKIGYKQEGLLREHYLIDNEPVNEVVYGILRKEFAER